MSKKQNATDADVYSVSWWAQGRIELVDSTTATSAANTGYATSTSSTGPVAFDWAYKNLNEYHPFTSVREFLGKPDEAEQGEIEF